MEPDLRNGFKSERVNSAEALIDFLALSWMSSESGIFDFICLPKVVCFLNLNSLLSSIFSIGLIA